MKRAWQWMLGVAVLGVVGTSSAAPAFASSSPLTLEYVSGEHTVTTPFTGTGPGYTIKVSGVQPGSNNSLIVQYYHPGTGWETNFGGTPLGSSPSWYNGQVGTLTLNVPGNFTNTTGIRVEESIDDSAGHASNTAPSNAVYFDTVPYGELPQVPWAAGIPLVGIGIGAAHFMRRRRSLQAAPSRTV